jgi:hypothetical protein
MRDHVRRIFSVLRLEIDCTSIFYTFMIEVLVLWSVGRAALVRRALGPRDPQVPLLSRLLLHGGGMRASHWFGPKELLGQQFDLKAGQAPDSRRSGSRVIHAWLVAAGLVLWAQPAVADLITYVEDFRELYISSYLSGDVWSAQTVVPDPAFSAFSETLEGPTNLPPFPDAVASQTSLLGPNSMTVSSATDVRFLEQAESDFWIAFHLDSEVSYSYTGSYLMSPNSKDDYVTSKVSLELRRGPLGTPLYQLEKVFLEYGSPGEWDIAGSGSLLPGDYQLRGFIASSGFDGGLPANLDLVFTVVPEPSTALPIALGLAAAGRRPRSASGSRRI